MATTPGDLVAKLKQGSILVRNPGKDNDPFLESLSECKLVVDSVSKVAVEATVTTAPEGKKFPTRKYYIPNRYVDSRFFQLETKAAAKC